VGTAAAGTTKRAKEAVIAAAKTAKSAKKAGTVKNEVPAASMGTGDGEGKFVYDCMVFSDRGLMIIPLQLPWVKYFQTFTCTCDCNVPVFV
jgi:hypothetical protein